jgi:murein DD-endopeptidase MepM/ murein hydrolase activator NlpD
VLVNSRPSPKARVRRLAAEVLIVAVSALSAVAVAHASLLAPAFATLRPTTRALVPVAPALPAGESADDDILIAFQEPVPGHAVVSPFGLRQLPWEGAGRLHEGVDISADAGVPVRVAADGVVVAAGEKGGYGRYVAVQHAEGLTTFYAHLGGIVAGMKPGVTLTAGDAVGRVGSTGTSTGPHLHFEIRDDQDRPLNPAMFLGKAFAEAGDLPLDKAVRYSGRVRMAQVSRIPASKQALMDAKNGAPIIVRRSTDAQDLAQAERNLRGMASDAAKAERIDGLRGLSIGPDGRPRAQLGL